MRELTDKNFGIVIAYLTPGFVVLWGCSYFSETARAWLVPAGHGGEATLGSFLFALLASLSLGLLISAARWAVIDTLHHMTGVPRPELNFSVLHEKLESFLAIVEANYRFYQFYANMAIALPLAALCKWKAEGDYGTAGVWIMGTLSEGILLAGSRDSLSRYYRRAAALLGTLNN